MKKDERLKIIEEIITGGVISSQEQLLRVMEGKGIKCTQATLSRDLRHLGVFRFTGGEGLPVYRVARGSKFQYDGKQGIYHRAIESLTWARDLLIIKTSPGFAAGVASAVDRCGFRSVAGTVAGDDTIILVPSEDARRPEVMNDIDSLFPDIGTLRTN